MELLSVPEGEEEGGREGRREEMREWMVEAEREDEGSLP